MTVYALTCPGQGSQTVGMGKELANALPAAREVFEEVDEALGESLSALMFDGPQDELTLTQNAQPALMAVSVAVVRALEARGGFRLDERAAFAAGHSLGEYSALCAAGSIGLADTARLLRARGLAMQAAVPVGEGAMAAILGLDLDDVREVAETAAGDEVCAVANDNSPGQVVVSGSRGAVERAIEIAKEKGARRGVLLPVSAPFHCSLMEPAADAMAAALADVEIRAPSVTLVANVTASGISDPEDIRRLLVEQVTGMVRWRECVGFMVENGIDQFIEAGVGNVLGGLLRRISGETPSASLHTPEEIAAFVDGLEEGA